MPAKISKFLPEKVISSGTALFKNNQYNVNSTGILTILSHVIFVRDSLFMNTFPFDDKNKYPIIRKDGTTNNGNFGNDLRSVLNMSKCAKIAWAIRKTTKPIEMSLDSFGSASFKIW